MGIEAFLFTAAITMNVDVEDAILEHVEAGGQ